MARTTIEELRTTRLAAMSADERAMFDAIHEVTRLTLDAGEKVRDAREAAGRGQRELAARMSTSQTAVASLEAATLAPPSRRSRKSPQASTLRFIIELSAPIGKNVTDA